MDKEYFDVGVIIPLEQELKAFFETFPSLKNLSDEKVFLHEVSSGVSNLRMVLIHQVGMGHADAGQATIELLDRFEIGLVACLGIAGGLSSDLALGDVCYTGTVADAYENNSATDAAKESGTPSGMCPSSDNLRQRVRFLNEGFCSSGVGV